MKVTTLNPHLVTEDPQPIIDFFEELGFERSHTKEGPSKLSGASHRMKDDNGFHLDVSKASFQLPRDEVVIRMNVDDIVEASALLKRHGFGNALGDDRITETGSSRNAVMISPTGPKFTLIQHSKDKAEGCL